MDIFETHPTRGMMGTLVRFGPGALESIVLTVVWGQVDATSAAFEVNVSGTFAMFPGDGSRHDVAVDYVATVGSNSRHGEQCREVHTWNDADAAYMLALDMVGEALNDWYPPTFDGDLDSDSDPNEWADTLAW